jgi:hypothetical protein
LCSLSLFITEASLLSAIGLMRCLTCPSELGLASCSIKSSSPALSPSPPPASSTPLPTASQSPQLPAPMASTAPTALLSPTLFLTPSPSSPHPSTSRPHSSTTPLDSPNAQSSPGTFPHSISTTICLFTIVHTMVFMVFTSLPTTTLL